jgi:cytochrome c oxidase subunit 2
MKHFIGVAVLVAVLTVAVGFGLTQIGLLPDQASLQAVPIDALFQKHIWAIAFLFALIVGFMLYSIVVFRRRPGDESEGDHFDGHTGLEVFWTVVPLIAVLYFAYLGADALAETQRPDPHALEVDVIGVQWSWRFDYTEYGFSSTELRLPVDQQVLLNIYSTDVIHSFWVPEFRVKQDALPGEGMQRELRITPTELGEYVVRCAELCGTQHAYMTAPVIVMEAEDFEAWAIEKAAAPSDDPVERGAEWYQQYGCLACHSTDGSESLAPTWLGIYGSQETLTDATTVTVDDAYLFKSIREPQVQIVQGYEDILMPPTGETMTDEQVNDLVAFIKSLSE